MIKIYIGSVGSGKTVTAVRDLYLNKAKRKTYSNIVTKIPNQINLTANMILKKELVGYKKNRKTDEEEPVYELKLNIDFWKNIKEPINIILDEAHSIISSRRSMSKANILINDWLALIRRILGEKDGSYGELIFITQLPKRIDITARDMATQVQYTICHYRKICLNCKTYWNENSEMPELYYACPTCASTKLKKFNFIIEVWKFINLEAYQYWREFGQRTFYSHFYIRDIEQYFDMYNTFQWDSLFGEYY